MQIFLAVILTILITCGLCVAAFFLWKRRQLNDIDDETFSASMEESERRLVQLKQEINDVQEEYNEKVRSFNAATQDLQKEKDELEASIRQDYNNWAATKQESEKELETLLASKSEIETALSTMQGLQEKLAAEKSVMESENLKLEEEKIRLLEEHKAALQRIMAEFNGNFFMMHFTDQELMELEQLNKVIPLLHNPAPLCKAIYEMYFRDKMKQILSMAGLDRRFTGIYRLFMDVDGLETSYVGQSVDIGNRWQQHLKRFVGSEPTTGIRLYKEVGIKDLSKLKWEVIEEVKEQGLLNEREKYWIEFYNCGGGWNSK